MDKTQKFLRFVKSELGFSTILLALIIILFVTLSPKVSSLLVPFKRQAILNDFINKTKMDNGINAQGYWEFREFYSPGHFTFSRDGIAKPLLRNVQKEIGVKYSEKDIDLTYLFFSSDRLNSLDMLTKQSSLSGLIDQKQFQAKNVIFMDKNSLIYKEDAKTIRIVFLLSNSSMQKANGFFDYQEKDKKLTGGESWFNVTSLKVD
jgi:hypothetical protein